MLAGNMQIKGRRYLRDLTGVLDTNLKPARNQNLRLLSLPSEDCKISAVPGRGHADLGWFQAEIVGVIFDGVAMF